MKRWFLAVAFLLGGALTIAHADYIRLSYNLAPNKSQGNQQGLNQGGRLPGIGGGGGSGRPGIGGGGGSGRPGIGGGPGGGNPPPPPNDPSRLLPVDDENAIKAEVVVEYSKQGILQLTTDNRLLKKFPLVYHKWGKTGITETADITYSMVTENNNRILPVASRYKAKRKELLKDPKAADRADKYIELAKWALNHNLFDEFASIQEELAKIAPSHEMVRAFNQVKADLAKRPFKADAANVWKDKQFSNYKIRQTDHYTILFNASSNEAAEVTSFANHLENQFRGFYYWFALKGRVLPVPDRRLVAVVVDKPEEFRVHQQVFDNAHLVADGFYARRDNLLMFSAVRIDQTYEALAKATNSLWQNGWSREKLLEGKGHPGSSPDEVVKNQMIALLLKGMQEESTLASVSHEGARQLATVIGLLPSSVEVPLWIQFGVGSYFETPRGAYWPGMGAPSWRYLANFKGWEGTNKMDVPQDALRNVVTDKYFRDAMAAGQPKSALIKARTMSWSLAYFLAESKFDGLMRYFDELNNMPRDMEFDDDALMACFGRALDLADPTNPNQVNSQKFSNLAKEWFSFLHFTNLEASEAFADLMKEQKTKDSKKNDAGGGQDRSGAQ